MESLRFRNLLVAAVFGCGLLVGGSALAGIDVDFGAAVRIGDDADLFLAISSRHYDHDREVVQRWQPHCHSDDLAVALFVSRNTGRSLDAIFGHRRDGLSWWQISVRYGVPADAWFVPVRRDPGPPYGKAYGHWKKHRHDRAHRIVLTDADVRNLVAVRMVHEYYGVPVDVAMDWRASGKDVGSLVAAEYRKRHGNGKVASSGRGKSKHKGHPGKGKRK